jgi:hypothetical protein
MKRRAAIALAGILFASESRAQNEAELASRRMMLQQALEARERGEHAQALDLAQRAGKIKMTASVRRFLAEEQESLGRFAEALGSAETCVQEAQKEQGWNAEAVFRGCDELVKKLRPKVAEIVIKPEKTFDGLVVTVGGLVVSDALYGVPYIVTPGEITIEATSPNHEPFRTTVKVEARQQIEVPIHLVELPPPPPPKPETKVVVVERSRSPVGFVLAGSGAVILVAATILGIASQLTYDDLKAKCMAPARCAPSFAYSRQDLINTLDTTANVALVVGAVTTITGVILALTLKTGPKTPVASNAVRFTF